MWHNIDTRHFIQPPPKTTKKKRRRKKKSDRKLVAKKMSNARGDQSVRDSISSMGRPRSVLKAPGMLGAKFKKQVTIVEGDNVSIAASAAGRLESEAGGSSEDSDEESDSDSDDSFDSAEGESMSDDSGSDSAESSVSNVSQMKFKSKVRDSITSRSSLGKMFQR